MITRYASLRFEASIGPSDFDEIVRALSADGVAVASLNVAAERAYAALAIPLEYDVATVARTLASALPGARVDEPPLVVLDVRTETAADAERVRDAVGGPGGISGAVTRAAGERSTIVEIDETRTPLALVLDVIDIELRGRARRIVPMLPLDDRTLTRFASARLGEPDLDRSRLIETHLDAFDFTDSDR
jgi:hypothetical protein